MSELLETSGKTLHSFYGLLWEEGVSHKNMWLFVHLQALIPLFKHAVIYMWIFFNLTNCNIHFKLYTKQIQCLISLKDECQDSF